MTKQDQERYMGALHAVQTGVAMEIGLSDHTVTPKHLRVGINAVMCDSAALVKLLIAKGILTQDEYEKAIADEMEAEVKRYTERLTENLGRKVILK